MLYRYPRDRSGDHPVEHLETFSGILQADIYAGYNALYVAGVPDARALQISLYYSDATS